MCRLMAFINIFTLKVMSCQWLYFQPYLKYMLRHALNSYIFFLESDWIIFLSLTDLDFNMKPVKFPRTPLQQVVGSTYHVYESFSLIIVALRSHTLWTSGFYFILLRHIRTPGDLACLAPFPFLMKAYESGWLF